MCLALSLFHADSSFCYSRLSSTAIVCLLSDPFRFRCFSLQQRSDWYAISKRKSATEACTPGVGSDRVPWNKNTLAPHTPSFHTFSFPIVLSSPLSLCVFLLASLAHFAAFCSRPVYTCHCLTLAGEGLCQRLFALPFLRCASENNFVERMYRLNVRETLLFCFLVAVRGAVPETVHSGRKNRD